ncbi:conjugal transfer protein TraN, partial [Klebsiella pneumoniae]
SESLTLFERTFPIDVISWPRSESMCSGGQNTHCTKYTYDGKGKIHQSFGVDKAVTAGQNFSVSKTSRTVSSASQKPVQVTVTLVMEETETVYAPEVVWVESCPFSKDEG